MALNVGIFVCMLMGSGSLSDPDTIVRWGGSIGTRTANGEWWRLATAMFVHAGFFQVVANVAGLVQIGLITERFFGRFAFASAFPGAGLLFGVLERAAASDDGDHRRVGKRVRHLRDVCDDAGHRRRDAVAIQRAIDDVAEDRAVGGAASFLYSVAAGHAGLLELSGLAGRAWPTGSFSPSLPLWKRRGSAAVETASER